VEPDRPRAGAIAGFACHGVDIGWRGVLSVHPAASVREALGFLAWIIAGGYLLGSWRRRIDLAGAVLVPMVAVVLAAARLSPTGAPQDDLTLLGRIHISIAVLGVALFALASALAWSYLLEERNLKRKRFDAASFRAPVESLARLDGMSQRLVAVGFPLFTVAMVLGMIWVGQRGSGMARPEYVAAVVTWLCLRRAPRRPPGPGLARPPRRVGDPGRVRLGAVGLVDLLRAARGGRVTAELFVVGLSWRTAPVAVREHLAFAEDELAPVLADVRAAAGVAEAMLVSTCNRVEVYGAAPAGEGAAVAAAAARRALVARRAPVPPAVTDALYVRVGSDAIGHVFRVAAALDSLVVGEAQIFGSAQGRPRARHRRRRGPVRWSVAASSARTARQAGPDRDRDRPRRRQRVVGRGRAGGPGVRRSPRQARAGGRGRQDVDAWRRATCAPPGCRRWW
jgi:ABC-type uncharacterized transport system permease subunit